MNSYQLSRKWFDWCYDNPEKIKPNHTALYFFAIEHNNRLGWKEKFGLPTTMTKEAIGIRSYNTFINTLNDLVDWGFIKLIEKSKNQYSSNIIALSNFNKASSKALDKALIKHASKQSESTSESTSESIGSIDKPINNEQVNNKQVNKEQVYTKDVYECLDKIMPYFKGLEPNNKNIWHDTIDKLERIDGVPYDQIVEIVKQTRQDNFWAKNFLTITKLRKKNKDDVPYWKVFTANIISKQNERTNGLSEQAIRNTNL